MGCEAAHHPFAKKVAVHAVHDQQKAHTAWAFFIANKPYTSSGEAYFGKKLSQYTSNRLNKALMAKAICQSAAGSR